MNGELYLTENGIDKRIGSVTAFDLFKDNRNANQKMVDAFKSIELVKNTFAEIELSLGVGRLPPLRRALKILERQKGFEIIQNQIFNYRE